MGILSDKYADEFEAERKVQEDLWKTTGDRKIEGDPFIQAKIQNEIDLWKTTGDRCVERWSEHDPEFSLAHRPERKEQTITKPKTPINVEKLSK
jgi:hypothetical protein